MLEHSFTRNGVSMTKAITHIHFNGNCAEALNFYAKCLGGKIVFSTTWGETPAAKEVSTDWHSKIIHANMEFAGQMITGDDAPAGRYLKPQGFSIFVNYTVKSEAENAFQALSQNAKVHMPFGETFWSNGFGMLEDQFGISWMISSPKEM